MNFDISIIGGGLVGTSLACALADLPLKVVLFEPQSIHIEVNPNARALALSYSSIQFLEDLKVWLACNRESVPIQSVHVSKAGKFGSTRVLASEYNLPMLGSVINADKLLLSLRQRALKANNITIVEGESLTHCVRHASHWQLNERFQATLLVGADGGQSFVRKVLGIDSQEIDHRQCAISANVTLTQDQAGVAYERFLKRGSIAFLPVGEYQAKSVWILPTTQAEQMMQLSEQKYVNAIQDQFGDYLGAFINVGKRVIYPLKSIFASQLYERGAVLLGNAAHQLTPVAAQGFNLGLRDVQVLAQLIKDRRRNKQPIDSLSLLQEYAQKRTRDQSNVQQLTQRLQQESTNLTGLGIWASEWIPGVKSKIVSIVMGE